MPPQKRPLQVGKKAEHATENKPPRKERNNMKLIDLLLVIDENCKVIVWKDEDNYTYDGRDALPEELNNDEVASISHSTEAIVIFLK